MAIRYALRLYKGCSEAAFTDLLLRGSGDVRGRIVWDTAGTGNMDMRVESRQDVHSLYVPYQGVDSVFCKRVGELSGLVWIELRIQEGSLWDYGLFRGGQGIDNFSVCPQYWEGSNTPDEFLRQWRGDARVLAEAWQIPEQRVSRYLVNWGYKVDPVDERVFHFERSGLAYPSDKHPYGDYEQFFDVLHALGGVEPTKRHSIILPKR